jgi:hypothetical protein
MCVLILAVFKIRKFFKDNDILEELNKKLIVIHVLAFVIYALSVLPPTVLLVLYYLDPNNQEVNEAFNISIIPLATASTISQVLLCAILWQLGEKN